MRVLRSRMPLPPVAHLRFAHDGAARQAEPHALRVELRSDLKGGVALPGYFPTDSSTTVEPHTKRAIPARLVLNSRATRPEIMARGNEIWIRVAGGGGNNVPD